MFWGRYFVIVIGMFISIQGYASTSYHYASVKRAPCKNIRSCKKKKKERLSYRIINGTATILKEAILLNGNLFSANSAKVFTAFTPFYITMRMADHPVHEYFYDAHNHKNIRQLPDTVCKVVNKMGDVGIISLTSLAFFASDERLRLTARIFGIGAASALLAKDLIKIGKCEAAVRPWNEKFKKKRTYGGFPSGHMIEASYMATVWGLQYGWKAAVPLLLFAGLSFGVLVNCNRHYVSQIVAGAGVGVAYGLAANTLINTKIAETITFDFKIDERALPTISLAYNF